VDRALARRRDARRFVLSARSRSRIALALALPLSAAVGACQLFADFGDVPTVARDGGASGSNADASADGAVISDGGSAGNDASRTDGASASDAGPACDPSKPFGAPTTTIFSYLNTTTAGDPTLSQFEPRLSADELTVYYSVYPGVVGGGAAPGADIFTAGRAKIGDSFGPGSVLMSIDTDNLEQHATVSTDGLTLFFTVDYRNGAFCTSHDLCIAKATRAATTADFGNAAITIDQVGSQTTPYVVGNGPEVYYAFEQNLGTGDFDIVSSAGGALLFKNVNSAAREDAPAVTPDGLTLYFASARASDAGDVRNIYVATRGATTDPWGPPSLVTELASATDEAPGFISADGCRLYFTRDDGNAGGLDMYSAVKGF
jgi:hypothetical protein